MRGGEPKRIQLRRTKGWRKPEGAVVVSRPSKWGNPFGVGNAGRGRWVVYDDRSGVRVGPAHATKGEASAFAVDCYRHFVLGLHPRLDVAALRGLDLCCWCPPEQACHADVLLELANAAPVVDPGSEGA